MPFTLHGLGAVSGKLREIALAFDGFIEESLLEEAEFIVTDAKQNYVPVDHGLLRANIRVDGVDRNGADVVVTFSSSGPQALSIHENPSGADPVTWVGVDVQFSPEGTGPKYLEKPLNAATPGMASRIAQKVKPR